MAPRNSHVAVAVQHSHRGALRALAWGLAFFVCAQLGLLLLMEGRRPELRDPEYGNRLACLRERLRAEPQRPLLLALGSSRTEMGFRPQVLPPLPSVGGAEALTFNFGLAASGPVEELICLHRLLAAGIHPTWVIIEVLPLALAPVPFALEEYIPVDRLAWEDLGVLEPYCSRSRRLYQRWGQARLEAWSRYRLRVQNQYTPLLLPETYSRNNLWNQPDRSGWMPARQESTEIRRHALQVAQATFAGPLQALSIGARPARPLRDLLGLCRQAGICVTLLLMPESSEFRSWYTPTSRDVLDGYLAALTQENEVALIDARSWVADEGFLDGHHLLPDGAAVFTQRLGRELLRPLVTGGADGGSSARRERSGQPCR